MPHNIKVGLIIDEFFGGAGTGYGGYGILARNYIAKYIPCEDIQIDVLLGRVSLRKFFKRKWRVDGVDLYKLPRLPFFAKWWLRKKNYDVYLSIELTRDYVLRCETNPNKRLILWIQDPRPKYVWDTIIKTMRSINDIYFYNQQIYDTVHTWAIKNRIKFISQGFSLNTLAMELYNLPQNIPIQYLPNPVDIDRDFKFNLQEKKKNIIFLARIEAQKRCWLFCEIAKKMPEYQFYVLGQFFNDLENNKRMMRPYMSGDIKNLHFTGRVHGEEKNKLIKEARILVSTSIWEGIPVSWLEALSYGTILVSDLERENLVEKFGIFVGEIAGDGFEGVDKFIPAIKEMMENDTAYQEKAQAAIEYVRNVHTISRFISDMREVIRSEADRGGANP